MISAEIPMTITSTADLSLSIDEFIEYSIKNDLHIVTVKWLAHTRKITITEAKQALNRFWESFGRDRNYCATFSVLSLSESDGYSLELFDLENLPSSNVISTEIYAIHAVPIKDKSVQFGLINVPIFDLPSVIEAPWIDSSKFPKLETCEEVALKISEQKLTDEHEMDVEMKPASVQQQVPAPAPLSASESQSNFQQPPEKKMKLVPTVRTFMHNGYQMTEVVNEQVQCDDTNTTTTSEPSKPVAPAPVPAAKAKQSSMMNFFKKK